MALEQLTEPRRGLRIPIATLIIVGALALGVAAGVYALRAATNTAAVPALPATVVGAGEPASGIAIPVPAHVVPFVACAAMDAAGRSMYCNQVPALPVAPQRATWQACAAMDVTAYRMYCHLGDGGRWIEGSEPAPLVP